MNRYVLATAIALAFGAAPAIAQTSSPGASGGQQMSQAECTALWTKAGASGTSDTLSQEQAQPYVQDFSQVDTNSDGSLSSTEFLSACQRGMVSATATTGAGTGSPGSKSKQ